MDEAEIDDKARLTAEMAFQEDSTAVIRRRQSLPDNPVTVILSVLMVLLTVAATMVKVTGLNPNRLLGLHSSQQNMIHAAATYRLMDSALLLFLIFRFHRSRRSLVYLVDFSCHKPEDQFKTSRKRFVKLVEESGSRHEESIKFVRRITSGACMGDESYLPRGSTNSPPIHNIEEARAESETSIFGALDSLFDKTALKPCDIDILVLNSSLFSLVPSLSSMIVNHYKLRTDIKTYNLGGMGCSAGLVSIDLANTILRGNPDSYAVVVSTENINENWYQGNDRSMLISLCLFRWGTSAVLLSNKARDRSRSKYELLHLVRTHTGANEKHFDCAAQREDEFGIVGISLSKELMAAAGEALKTNIFSLGRLVLPWREQLRFLVTLVLKKVFKSTRKVKPYTPDFKLAFEHFCIHTGGRAVLDAMQKNLELDDWRMEPSRMTLHRFGNTSSSSLWYELAYTEAKGRVRRGDRVWQLGFGSGFKCNSAVWRALRDISVGDWRGNPWDDSIDKYPVKLTTSS